MVSECLSLADAAQDTVGKHAAPTPLNTRRQERRSGKREPCTLERGGVSEGTVLSKPRSLGLCCLHPGCRRNQDRHSQDVVQGCRERCRSLFRLCSGEYPTED